MPSRTMANLLDILVAYALIEAALWTQLHLASLAAAWVVVATLWHRRSPRALGLMRPPSRPSALILAGGALAGAAIVFSGSLAGTLHDLYGQINPWWHAAKYLFSALGQQFLVQSFFFLRLEELLQDARKAVVVTALLFLLAHVPNPVLVPLGLVAGLVFSELFRRYRSIYAIGLAHGLLGLAIAVSVPDQLHHHMRVGIGYLRYP